jgi:class 3 adenylate cyclase
MERAKMSWLASLPRHRAIIALDIEQSTRRTDAAKAEFRRKIYELFDAALCSAGIQPRHRDRFVDRGDGVLALIHPVDQAPKAILLGRVVPVLNQLLADYNASRPQQLLRIRVVVHAGEVSYDANGCFGEALDVAFRLLDAAKVKKALKTAVGPLLLVVSEEIYRTVVRHGYGGIDRQAFRRLVRVQIAGNRYPGWIHAPERQARIAPLTWPVSVSAANSGLAGAAPRGLETLVPPPRETLASPPRETLTPQPAGMPS